MDHEHPLPADSHVHSEYSWDAPLGSMERACARAVELGLPAIAFTEHLDHTAWPVPTEGPYADQRLLDAAGPDGRITPPPFDTRGYLASIERCRDRFPTLTILSGLEVGEPHWHRDAVAAVLAEGPFDRVIGSLHCLPHNGGYAEPFGIFPDRPNADVVRDYLREIPNLVTGSDVFEVLTHIDYPIRHWPGPERFDPRDFEEEFRDALRATARAGRALEINTRLPMDRLILTWWHQEGGEAVSFGSDAHVPEAVANGLREAAAMAEACGFRAGRRPYELWGRVS
ncbi:PHP domain-containing protein [Actinoplanes missouriensis]|uniref:PHP domain-containing protein n=1 Tax=Actinoplanes missouriensis TaxID=1866 RepID=UPI00340E2E16